MLCRSRSSDDDDDDILFSFVNSFAGETDWQWNIAVSVPLYVSLFSLLPQFTTSFSVLLCYTVVSNLLASVRSPVIRLM